MFKLASEEGFSHCGENYDCIIANIEQRHDVKIKTFWGANTWLYVNSQAILQGTQGRL